VQGTVLRVVLIAELEHPPIIEDDESGSVRLRSKKRQTSSRGDSRGMLSEELCQRILLIME
jgi:hypothetical protein